MFVRRFLLLYCFVLFYLIWFVLVRFLLVFLFFYRMGCTVTDESEKIYFLHAIVFFSLQFKIFSLSLLICLIWQKYAINFKNDVLLLHSKCVNCLNQFERSSGCTQPPNKLFYRLVESVRGACRWLLHL